MIQALQKAEAVLQLWGLILFEWDRNLSFPSVLSIKKFPMTILEPKVIP